MKKKKIPGPSYKRKSGIYKITCIATGDTYVGKSKCLSQRYCHHDFDLRRHKHPNPIMQQLHDTHGKDSLVMELLELVDDLDALETREVHWIQELGPSMNVVDTKLSARDVKTIKLLNDVFNPTEVVLAAQFNITVKYLREILRGNKWKTNDPKIRENN